MNKLFLLIFAGVLFVPNVAWAARVSCKAVQPSQDSEPLAGVTYVADDTCYADNTNSACYNMVTGTYDGCYGTTESELSGIISTTKHYVEQEYMLDSVGATTGTITCSCKSEVTGYRCATGYYGTATSARAGCTVCPENATCTGGNDSTFSCNVGYYKNAAGDGCEPCPEHVESGAQTSSAGVVDVTGCYVPSSSTWTDEKGTLSFEEDCHYTE